MDTTFGRSHIQFKGAWFETARRQGRDVIIVHGPIPTGTGLSHGVAAGQETVFPASYENMLAWERTLAPQRKLIAINQSGFPHGFGAGNRMVLAQKDLADLTDQTTFAGWDGIYRGMLRSAAPFWFIQQSIVRELIPDGVDAKAYPGIGHTGGYGPREFLRAGLFAYASQGGYGDGVLPIGADADHAIITGFDEESLQRSVAFNKLAMTESSDYTKYTVDTSHLFDFPVQIGDSGKEKLAAAFAGRRFQVENIVPGRPGYDIVFDDDEIELLGHKYWQACAVHKDLYDYALALRAGRPFDYELSLDETPQPTPPRDLLFYMVLLQDVMDVPAGGVASAGPNIGFIKRHDFKGDLQNELLPQVEACASMLRHFGAMLSVHSADGVRAATGKGSGVDAVLLQTTGGKVELKVADVYQEVLWEVLAASPDKAEREVFLESWRRTYEAAKTLGELYQSELAGMQMPDVQRMLASAEGKQRLVEQRGEAALSLAQATVGYGLPVFRLAAQLAPITDPASPDPTKELFRRFMFLTYRPLRPHIFRTMTHDGWERLAAALEEATMVRLRAMNWTKKE